MNLLFVIVFVQMVQILVSYFEYSAGGITFEVFWHLTVISIMGRIAPETCVVSSEFFTGIEYWPVRTLAQNAHLGVVQVVLPRARLHVHDPSSSIDYQVVAGSPLSGVRPAWCLV